MVAAVSAPHFPSCLFFLQSLCQEPAPERAVPGWAGGDAWPVGLVVHSALAPASDLGQALGFISYLVGILLPTLLSGNFLLAL